jgi:hypothetical protein
MDYAATLNNLLEYYQNLLIIQYNGKNKASATIKMIANLILANLLILQVRDGFSWRTAVGYQLDIIGKWLGVTRDYKGSLYWGQTFLSYPNSGDLVPDDKTDNLQHGYSDYDTFETDTGGVLTYESLGFVEQSLSDDDYRIILGLKIIKNSINHTAKNIDDAIWEYFNGQVYTTWEPYEIIYHYPSSMTTIIEVCNYKNVLPAPTGVSIVLREI